MNLAACRDGLRRHARLIVLCGLIAVAYLAAINRAQAFPWATAALLSATLLTGFAAPHWLVRRLSVARRGPVRAEKGETVLFQVEVHNAGWLPRFMVELMDRLPFVAAVEQHRIGAHRIGLLTRLPARQTSHFEIPVLCEKRGYYQLGPIGLASSFPLGLAEARQTRNEGVQSLTVYPDVFDIVALPLHGAPSQIHRGGALLPEGAGAAEFSGLREYRRGDNPRHIHWPSSARLNELIVREYEPLASACLSIVLDQSEKSNIGRGKESTFEYAVRIAGSLARHACMQCIPTRLSGHGRMLLQIPATSGETHYGRILDQLAVVEADGGRSYADLLRETADQAARGETLVVFVNDEAMTAGALAEILANVRARQLHLLAVLFAGASFRGQRVSPGAAPGVAALIEAGAQIIRVRQGDDLLRLFNP